MPGRDMAVLVKRRPAHLLGHMHQAISSIVDNLAFCQALTQFRQIWFLGDDLWSRLKYPNCWKNVIWTLRIWCAKPILLTPLRIGYPKGRDSHLFWRTEFTMWFFRSASGRDIGVWGGKVTLGLTNACIYSILNPAKAIPRSAGTRRGIQWTTRCARSVFICVSILAHKGRPCKPHRAVLF